MDLVLRLRGLFSKARFPREKDRGPAGVAKYWTKHTVHLHDRFIASREASLEYFHWRCEQYPGYLDLMPVGGLDHLDVLDFGCGPAHDMVGIGTFSKVKSLTGADVSLSAVEIARRRLSLHEFQPPVSVIALEPDGHLPCPENSFDYIHCSGVLHHLADLPHSLDELKRVLRPAGRIRVMIYNRESLWYHLYVPYVLQLKTRQFPKNLSIEEAFRASTDGAGCPISSSWTSKEFGRVAENSGLTCEFVGTSISRLELDIGRRFLTAARIDRRLADDHREFLQRIDWDLTCDSIPTFEGNPAGINLSLELRHTPG